MICGKNEPDGLGAAIGFWIDCSPFVDSGHITCVCSEVILLPLSMRANIVPEVIVFFL